MLRYLYPAFLIMVCLAHCVPHPVTPFVSPSGSVIKKLPFHPPGEGVDNL